MEEYGPDLVSVIDDEGNQHQFEILDAIETDEKRYVALTPVYDSPDEALEDDGELIVLEVASEDGEDLLIPIEDDDEFGEIAAIFEERLSEYYEIAPEEGEEVN